MLKITHILAFAVVAVLATNSVMGAKCPDYSAQKEINKTALVGRWIYLAMSPESFSEYLPCKRANFAVNGGNLTIDFTAVQLRNNLEKLNLKFNFKFAEKKTGHVIINTKFPVKSIFSRNRYVEKDVDVAIKLLTNELMLIYSCTEIPRYLGQTTVESFTILVREGFNDLNKFFQAVGILKELDVDLNKIKFPFNGSQCPQ